MQSPEVLLLDEPFSALDSFTKANLQEHVKNLWFSLKITIIMVTHVINEATTMSDRIVVLKKPNENKVTNSEIVKIDCPRSDHKKDEYNEIIKKSILNAKIWNKI